MKIAVWGAGNVGTGLAYRMVTTSIPSELVWINRTYESISKRVVDLEQGLAFAPSCSSVRACQQEHAKRELPSVDLLILTQGQPVDPDSSREALYAENAKIYRDSVLPALKKFEGIALVISNPVDLLARLLHVEGRLASGRVMGLGTVVESCRLRSSIGAYLTPMRPGRDVQAHAIGTHNKEFVPVVDPRELMALDDDLNNEDCAWVVGRARKEVAIAADRVRETAPVTPEGCEPESSVSASSEDEEVKLRTIRSSIHPIVESAVKVAEALARNAGDILTVSVLDPESGDDALFYSMPCTIGRAGVLSRDTGDLGDEQVKAGIDICCAGLREVLQNAGEI